MTASAYDLNLKKIEELRLESGIAGADARCSAEANQPAKALLVDEDGCDGLPCRRASSSAYAGDGQIGRYGFYSFVSIY